MPDIRSRREVSSRGSARHSWLLALVVFVTSVAISGAASPDGSPRAAARAVPAQNLGPLVSGAAALRGNDSAAAPAATKAAAPASGALPRAAVRTMSMDAPIQSGLSAHQEQALSARLLSAHQIAATAPQSEYWTPAVGRSAVARAESWLGMPYSWAGGNAFGPTPGRCDPGAGADLDCHVVGFDCSGLTMYAWGAYVSLPHLADAQRDAGAFHPTLKQLLPGDLVFFSGYLAGGTGHVAIYAGDGMVIEAPQSGSVIRRSALAEVMAQDGVYRGAMRPLTGETPTLTAPRVAVPPAGGTVTLRGAHLASVDTVHLGGVAVRQFVQHSDSAIVFRAPAHHHGTVAVTVSTVWQAQSRSVTLTYAQPRPATPATSPTAPASPSAPAPASPTAHASPTAPASPSTAPTAPPTSTTAPPTPSSTASISVTLSSRPSAASSAPTG